MVSIFTPLNVTSHCHEPLLEGWQLTSTQPGAYADADALAAFDEVDWLTAPVPGTVAMAMRDRESDPWQPAIDYDALDWWYQCRFQINNKVTDERLSLYFAGLATLAEVWLNGECVLSSNNMFRAYSVDVTGRLHEQNHLAIVFRSIEQALAVRRSRPRWKTRLVDNQQLRWIRTSLLGRIPAWTPPLKAVGPWREIFLQRVSVVELVRFDLRSTLQGSDGHVQLSAELVALESGWKASSASLLIAGEAYPVAVTQQSQGVGLTADFSIINAPIWWPHTHGLPQLLHCELRVDTGDSSITIDCGKIGFKSIELNRNRDRVQFELNGEPIFCRGACWTVNDLASLSGSDEQLRQSLILACNAGINMLRVGGTMIYESDRFYALCDELGILVWQDFMFANMDYPVDDAEFMENVSAELTYQLKRLQPHVCITAYCGNSEVQQQAAMFGAPQEIWSNALFEKHLPALCAKYDGGTPYFPSTPCEGALPFHVGTGLAHYFGVGAYQRPLHDVVAARVRFTPECLGFSNIPDAQTLNEFTGMEAPPPHQPLWKSRVPRDGGTGWDFEDIRDHYLAELFAVDPARLRYSDLPRYFDLSKVVTGEVMATAFAWWRSAASECSGGLVWFYKDLWPGAGWGIVDSHSRPKPVYYYLRRAWATRTLLVHDDGLDGLQLSIINESDQPLSAHVELTVFQNGTTAIATGSAKIKVAARSEQALSADAVLGHFFDLSYAYKFGPVKHDVVACALLDAEKNLIADSYHFPNGLNLPIQQHATINADISKVSEDELIVTLSADCFLQAVNIAVRDYLPEDNYFHLAPGRAKAVRLQKTNASGKSFRGFIKALNLREAIALKL